MEQKAAPGLPLAPKFAGIIFDLDGTLLDTLGDIANAGNAVLARHGFPTHPVSDYRAYVGEGVQVLLTRALPVGQRDPETVRACLHTMQVEYPRHLNQTAQPYPGVLELLAELKRQGLLLGILSNKPDEFTARCVADFFPDHLFDPILGLSPDRPRKPNPAGAFEIARRWGLPPARILYLGDSGTDIETAVAAGMFPVGVLWGYRDESELTGAGARKLLARPAALLDEKF
jgi:phosphoglycolate phosphatase